jgi:putative GTP pyrophosphokinase
MKHKFLDKKTFQKEYEADFRSREFITKEIESFIEKNVADLPSHLTVKGRVKSFDSFFRKYIRYLKDNKISCEDFIIPDQIGIRVICPFIEDTRLVENILNDVFEVVEIERKGSGYSFKEFGYESTHVLVKVPFEIGEKYKKTNGATFSGDIAEVQIRTILQDAWAEVEHELVYKAEFRPFDAPMKRKLAAINASLSLADTIFQEIRVYQRQLNSQLGKRQDSFFKQVEETTDSFLFENADKIKHEKPIQRTVDNSSIDDLLLNALYAHNRGLFSEAINYYSGILELNPDNQIAALICKHRGMAYFAQSLYEDAIQDFNKSLQFDAGAYKSAYYCGVVCLVLQRYSNAIDDFTKSLAINGFQPYCFYRRAEAYYHLDDYPQALSDCEMALSLDSDLEGAIKLKELLLNKLKM